MIANGVESLLSSYIYTMFVSICQRIVIGFGANYSLQGP